MYIYYNIYIRTMFPNKLSKSSDSLVYGMYDTESRWFVVQAFCWLLDFGGLKIEILFSLGRGWDWLAMARWESETMAFLYR